MKGSGGTIDLSDDTLKMVAKVAHDTAEGFSQDIMKIVHKRPDIGRKDLEVKLKLTPTRVHRVITDLKTLGLIRTKTLTNVRPTRSGVGQGRPSESYIVHPEFEPLMDDVFGG
jgi:predicted ArsR family transcriptional regulator